MTDEFALLMRGLARRPYIPVLIALMYSVGIVDDDMIYLLFLCPIITVLICKIIIKEETRIEKYLEESSN